MRKQFLGHFKETDGAVEKLWKTATFVFDANVLLNLYRYSDLTRSDFLKLLKTIKDRSWLPEQAAYEFLINRASVINDQVSSYERTLKSINTLCDSFSGSRGHPFITPATKTKFDSAIKMINDEMAKNKSEQEKLIHRDHIKTQIADLFDGSVGASYKSDELTTIFKEGEERYIAKTPPGYKDGNKISEPRTEADKRSNFGDWIIWKQVMDQALSTEAPIIFVTDDGKEDWWEKVSGKTLGPRPELLKEFAETTNQKILIYTPESFLNVSKTQLSSKIKQKSIVEVKQLKRERQNIYERIAQHERQRAAFKNQEHKLEDSKASLRYLKKMHGRNLEEYQQGSFRRLDEKHILENDDAGSVERQSELLGKLEAAISRKNELMRRAKLLSAEHGHFGGADDDEMIHMRRFERKSIEEELNGLTDLISDIKGKLDYFRGGDDLF